MFFCNSVKSQEEKLVKADTIVKEVRLSEVVVSALLYERPSLQLSKSVSIIDKSVVRENINSNFIDLLNNVAGFTQIWEYHSPIILRGMNSKRLLIMQNSCRKIGTFPGGYFAQDLNVYGSNKIEIIKGAGSVIYGSGAISGIINVINKAKFGDLKTTGKLSTGYGTNNGEYFGLLDICHRSRNLSIRLNSKYRKTDDYHFGGGDIAENSSVTDKDIGLCLAYKLDSSNTFFFNTNYHYGNWGKPRGFNGPTKYFTEIRNKEFNGHADIRYSYHRGGLLEDLSLNIFYDTGKRDYYKYKHSLITGDRTNLDLVHYKNQYGGGRLYSILNIIENIKLSVGADGYKFILDNPSEIVDYYNNTKGYRDNIKEAGQSTLGVFLTNEYLGLGDVKIVGGIRYDIATIEEGEENGKMGSHRNLNAVSGNISMVYSLSNNTFISFNIGRAFRIPTAEELFTQIISCKGVKKGNPNLKPEYGWDFDLGYRGSILEGRLSWDLALFYNKLEGYINEIGAPKGSGVDFTYENTNAKILGGEFSSTYSWINIFNSDDRIIANGSLSYVYGIDEYKGDKPLFGIPPCKSRFSIQYKSKQVKSIIKSYNFKIESLLDFEQNRVPEIPKDSDVGPWGYLPSASHMIFNMSCGLSLNNLLLSPSIKLKINNILDTEYHPWGSYILGMGRNIKLMLVFRV